MGIDCTETPLDCNVSRVDIVNNIYLIGYVELSLTYVERSDETLRKKERRTTNYEGFPKTCVQFPLGESECSQSWHYHALENKQSIYSNPYLKGIIEL